MSTQRIDRSGVRRGVPVLPEAVRRRRVTTGEVTDARDAEVQKTRNWSLAIGPLIVYPDVAG
jgi:hypothetical protein